MSTLRLFEWSAKHTYDHRPHAEWQVVDRGVHVATLTDEDILRAADEIRAQA